MVPIDDRADLEFDCGLGVRRMRNGQPYRRVVPRQFKAVSRFHLVGYEPVVAEC